ncbi:MAG: hypothetical protein HY791_16775 [Deltaproteobacteria bacterium]|nr:hypothetical protein [Deltaproteobacteria bacterium]
MRRAAPGRALWLLTASLAACAPPPRWSFEALELPTGWIGFLFLDASGDLVGATGLAAYDPGRPTLSVADEVPSSAERIAAVSWSRERLETVFPPTVEELFSAPLLRATESNVPLPTPDWSATGSPGEPLRAGPPPFSVGAGWLPRCDDAFEGSGTCAETEWVVEISCGDGPVHCDAKLRQRGCDLELEGTSCGVGKLVAAVSARDAICVPETPQHGCGRGTAGFECKNAESTCSAVIRGRAHQPAIAVKERARLFDLPLLEPSSIDLIGFREFGQADYGYAPDLAVNGDLLGVITFDGRSGDAPASPEPDRLIVLRADDFSVVASSTTPPGARRIGRDPAGPGFVVAFEEPLRIGRTDGLGRVTELREIPVDPALRATPSALVTPTWLSVNDDVIGLCAWIDPRAPTGSREERQPASIVRLLDARTLATEAAHDFPQTRFRQLERVSAGAEAGWIVTDDFSDTVIALSLPELEVRATSQLKPQRGGRSLDVFAQTTSPAELVLPALGTDSSVHVLSGGDDEGRSAFYEPMAAPTALAHWPPSATASESGSLVLTAAIDANLEAHLALFDPSSARFLPGSVPVGRGVVRRFVLTAENEWVALLPWSAELVRVTRVVAK